MKRMIQTSIVLTFVFLVYVYFLHSESKEIKLNRSFTQKKIGIKSIEYEKEDPDELGDTLVKITILEDAKETDNEGRVENVTVHNHVQCIIPKGTKNEKAYIRKFLDEKVFLIKKPKKKEKL